MAEVRSTVIVPLREKNYPTWKVQCRMALVKDGLWGVVDGTDTDPGTENVEARRKYLSTRDRALAMIVLSMEPSLLYLIGDPQDPGKVWKTLQDHFQKKTWANRLELRRKLYALRLKEGDSVQEHVRRMTEIFEELSVIDAPVSDEDKVVHLLASLPDSFGMLVTALEANSETVPKLELVTERLLHEEQKLKKKDEAAGDDQKALAAKRRLKSRTCHFCGKPGHIKRDCWKLAELQAVKEAGKKGNRHKHTANKVTIKQKDREVSSDSDNEALVVGYALAATSKKLWIVDSGATCHMCNDKTLFSELTILRKPQEVSLGDGHVLEAIAEGTVSLQMLLPERRKQRCSLKKVLWIPNLSHNLLSVSRASEAGKTVTFDDSGCEITNTDGKCIATASKIGDLYFLNLSKNQQSLNMITEKNKERLWHRRYGHLSEQGLQKLAKKRLVDNFDYDAGSKIGFCEACIGGKHHRSPFDASDRTTSEHLELVHTDLCGKMGVKSIGGAEYFISFTDDKTRYSWVYPLKTKDQAFDYFLEWKALVEKSSGKKLKTIRSDNGGEYTSKRFEAYLKSEGICHECTIPKTPEQNGIAERLNRTLVESSRSMLLDADLPQRFWAEAVSTANYLKNRCPSRAVKGMTPYEAWHGTRPKVEHLRVFGCESYAHIPKDERRKFDSKARKCILLGYGERTKGYRLYDPVQQKVLHSRDVRFNEEEKQVRVNSESTPRDDISETHRVALELPCEPEIDTTDLPNDHATMPTLRRSTRERHPPDYYRSTCSYLTIHREPATYEEAVNSPDSTKWSEAMESEMRSLNDNDVWDVVPLPNGKQVVGSKWVYKIKRDADGNAERHKARLVAQGFTQQYGADYDETFSPVVRLESLRTLIAISVQRGFKLHHVDVSTAFLNGSLQEEVYMKQPKGFVKKGEENLVCKLKKSIYGLKQSSRCWNTTLHSHLQEMGFEQSTSDPCVYMSSGGDAFYIGVYVDDMILAGPTDQRIKQVKQCLSKKVDIKDLGKLHHFLGITVTQDEDQGCAWIAQPSYTRNLLEKFEMQDCKPVSTPVDANAKLQKANDEDDLANQLQYQSAIGSLMYLSLCTRPDIAFAVGNLAKFCGKPTKSHWTALKRVLRYLKGTVNYGILYRRQQTPQKSEFVGFSDADWAGDVSDRRSTSGYVFCMCGGAISWRSKKQDSVALSTAEAEYIALSSAAQESVWLRRLTTELGQVSSRPTTIYEDNQSAISMCKNPQYHGRAKHIDIRHHYIREQVSNKMIEVKYCPTDKMAADIFTKGLTREQFCRLREKIGILQF